MVWLYRADDTDTKFNTLGHLRELSGSKSLACTRGKCRLQVRKFGADCSCAIDTHLHWRLQGYEREVFLMDLIIKVPFN